MLATTNNTETMTNELTEVFLKEIKTFYTECYGEYGQICKCKFIENNTYVLSHCVPMRIQNWELLKAFAAKANVSVIDAIKSEYVYYCHCCGQDMENTDMKGQMYCSETCENAIETYGYMCYFDDCLMCKNEREETPPFLDRIRKFCYLSNLNDTNHKRSGFGVWSFRELEGIAARENITLQEALVFQNTGCLSSSCGRAVTSPKHCLAPMSEDSCAECAECQRADADLVCTSCETWQYCNYAVCFKCHYKHEYSTCVQHFAANDEVNSVALQIEQLSSDNKSQLNEYAHDYGVTLEEAFEKQQYCHSCTNYVVPLTYGPGHQFCGARCEVHYEMKPLDVRCPRCGGERENCALCDGEVFYFNQEVAKREMELEARGPILAAAMAYKELLVYNEIFASLIDLTTYLY